MYFCLSLLGYVGRVDRWWPHARSAPRQKIIIIRWKNVKSWGGKNGNGSVIVILLPQQAPDWSGTWPLTPTERKEATCRLWFVGPLTVNSSSRRQNPRKSFQKDDGNEFLLIQRREFSAFRVTAKSSPPPLHLCHRQLSSPWWHSEMRKRSLWVTSQLSEPQSESSSLSSSSRKKKNPIINLIDVQFDSASFTWWWLWWASFIHQQWKSIQEVLEMNRWKDDDPSETLSIFRFFFFQSWIFAFGVKFYQQEWQPGGGVVTAGGAGRVQSNAQPY